MKKRIIFAMLVAASVTIPSAFAQASSEVVEVSRDIKPAAIEEGLFPESICEAAKRKGIKCGGLPQPRVYELPPTFTFSRGTAVLSDEGKSVLSRFGDVMKARQGPDIRFKITGHTDVTGTEDINKKLSLERAAAVKTFLVKEYGINAETIQIEGLAANKLKRPDDPENAANRRVDIARVMSK